MHIYALFFKMSYYFKSVSAYVLPKPKKIRMCHKLGVLTTRLLAEIVRLDEHVELYRYEHHNFQMLLLTEHVVLYHGTPSDQVCVCTFNFWTQLPVRKEGRKCFI